MQFDSIFCKALQSNKRGLSSDELHSEGLTWQKSTQAVIETAQNWGQGPLRECNSSLLLLWAGALSKRQTYQNGIDPGTDALH